MANTIRETIIAAYMTRLASWTTGNGFNYSCGTYASRAVQEVESLPACVLWPKAEEVEQVYGRNVCKMQVRLEAIATVSSTNPSVVQEKLLGDAIKIMTDPSVTVTATIDSIFYTGGGPAGLQKGEELNTVIYADFEIKYETAIGNPYSQA